MECFKLLFRGIGRNVFWSEERFQIQKTIFQFSHGLLPWIFGPPSDPKTAKPLLRRTIDELFYLPLRVRLKHLRVVSLGFSCPRTRSPRTSVIPILRRKADDNPSTMNIRDGNLEIGFLRDFEFYITTL